MPPDDVTPPQDPAIEAVPERPEWLPAQFESPEALAKSYDESRREMDRLRSDNEKQTREFAEALQRIEAMPQQPAYQQGQDPLLQAASRAWEEGDMATVFAINAQISQAATAQIIDERLKGVTEQMGSATQADRDIALRLAAQQVATAYGDRWDAIAPELNERIQRPGVLPPNPSVEEYVKVLREQAQIVDYPKLQAQITAAEAERQAKLDATGLDAGTARVSLRADPNDKAWAEIKAADAGGWSDIVGG